MDADITVAYSNVERLIFLCVNQFIIKNHIPIHEEDELLAEANKAFVKAFHTHNPMRGSFSNWCWLMIGYSLRIYMRAWKRNAVTDAMMLPEDDELEEDLNEETTPSPFNGQCDFQFVDLLDDLSEDASAVVQLVFESPGELVEYMRCDCRYRNGRAARFHLRQYLAREGWTRGQITETFREIREALG